MPDSASDIAIIRGPAIGSSSLLVDFYRVMVYHWGMIVRIVKMTFEENKVESFIAMAATLKPQIKSYDGCQYLDILQDVKQKNVLFSYSHWDTEEHLNHYRYSEFFKGTWRTLSQWFSAKPKAWSTVVIE